MQNIEKSVLLPYTASQMHNLVADINSYPNFLPWCAKVEIFECAPPDVEAKIYIDFKGMKQFFHTRNVHTHDLDESSILMKLIDGPFKKFSGKWTFYVIDETYCKIDFSLNYEFNSKFLQVIIGPVFNLISKTFVDNFIKEAHKRYGKSS